MAFNPGNDFNWDEGIEMLCNTISMDDGMDDFGPPPPPKLFRKDRYSNAYGDYRGGYGPPGAFGGPPGGFGGGRPPFFGPPPFPQGPSGPDFMWGRGFGPNGPPLQRSPRDDKAYKYLLRCGVPKENLRNLPREIFQLYQPQYCGVCATSFNSFALSRVHYTSKNHQKNQRKYLAMRNEGGPQHFKEQVPLKARDLYCELCDVHITSKTHADSHYAGKPHRSIVEGRKQPKNAVLLQKHMQSRLDQLIRREKKFLKPVEEKVEETPEEPKPFDPELYCDICKTSVTCSDQMTMHLNGKKHLSKEKRHILAMMKGEANDKPDNEAAGGDATNEGNDQADGQKDADGQEEADDQVEAADDQGEEKKGNIVQQEFDENWPEGEVDL